MLADLHTEIARLTEQVRMLSSAVRTLAVARGSGDPADPSD
jgi:hypothetical protein